MSKFNKYAKQAEAVAKENMEAYKAAQERLKKAEDQKRNYPQRAGVTTAEYEAKRARAEADYLEAKEGLKVAKQTMEAGKAQLQEIKKALTADIESSFAADPAHVDNATMELLRAGILKPSEYARLYNAAAEADNPTMMRIIGKAARDKADADKDRLSNEDRSSLLSVAHAGGHVNGGEYLDTYHVIEDVYSRCVNNPGMIDHWDGLLRDAIDSF